MSIKTFCNWIKSFNMKINMDFKMTVKTTPLTFWKAKNWEIMSKKDIYLVIKSLRGPVFGT